MEGRASTLNAEQDRAVRHVEGPLMIIAGAGTGKTRVITEKIVHLVRDGGYAPDAILALTFTNKAAEEMAQRLSDALGIVAAEMWVTTFHSFCHRVLQESGAHLGISPRFRLLNDVGQRIFLRRLLPRLDLEYYLRLPDPSAVLGDFTRFISRAKDELIRPEEYEGYARRQREQFEAQAGSLPEGERQARDLDTRRLLEIARVYRIYQEEMRAQGLRDFGDLIVDTYLLFRDRPNVLRAYQERFQYILVDEFQDTNVAQIELLHLLSTGHGRVCVVGDDDQAIYRFRGASYASFVNFRNKYPQVETIKLTENFRSTQHILRAAASVIARNAEARYDPAKDLWTRGGPGAPVKILVSPDFESEARAIATIIEERMRVVSLEGRDYSRYAILTRAHAHRELLVKEFERRGIPYVVLGEAGYFECEEVRDVISYLRVLGPPERSVDLFRVLSDGRWGIPPQDLMALGCFARREGISLNAALERCEEAPGVSPPGAEGLRRARGLLAEALRGVPRRSASEVLQDILQRTGYLAELLCDDAGGNEARVRSLARLLRFVDAYCRDYPDRSLGAFLDYLDLYIEAGGEPEREEVEKGPEGVNFLTVHAAKGLEFDAVFVASLTRTRFPTARRMEAVEFPAELMREAVPPGDVHLQEERRLFYVAMTRARQELFLSGIEKRRYPLSPFVQEVMEGQKEAEHWQRLTIDPPADLLESTDFSMSAREEEILRLKREILSTINDLWETDVAAIGPEDLRADLETIIRIYWEVLRMKHLLAVDDPAEARARMAELDHSVLPHLLRSLARDPALPPPAKGSLERAQRLRGVAPQARLALPERLMLSFTQVDAYRLCPLRYKYAYVFAIPAPRSAALEFGTTMHAVLEAFFRHLADGGEPSEEHLLRLYEAFWAPEGYADPYQAEKYHEAGRAQLRAFYEKNRDQMGPPLYLEKAFQLPIGEDTLEGRIDRIDDLDGGKVEVIDYKTGKAKEQKEAEESLQLSIYALACREGLHLEPERLSFYYLTTNEKVTTRRSAEQLEETVEIVREVAGRIRRQEFSATPGYYCRWCDYLWVCPAAQR